MRKFDADYLNEYVMGSLTPEEEKEVAAYLSDHPDRAAEVRDLFELMAEVALTEEPAPLADNAETSLLERIRASKKEETNRAAPEADAREGQGEVRPPSEIIDLGELKEPPPESGPGRPRTGPNRRWMGLALAAAIAMIAYLGLQLRTPPVDRQLASICQEQSTSCEPIFGEADTQLGTLARRSSGLFVVLDDDPPEGQVYQAWEIAGGEPQSLGVWESRIIDISQDLGADSLFGVSIEPPGGSPQPTSSPIVVVPLS